MLLYEEVVVINRYALVRSGTQAQGLDLNVTVEKIGREIRVVCDNPKRRRALPERSYSREGDYQNGNGELHLIAPSHN